MCISCRTPEAERPCTNNCVISDPKVLEVPGVSGLGSRRPARVCAGAVEGRVSGVTMTLDLTMPLCALFFPCPAFLGSSSTPLDMPSSLSLSSASLDFSFSSLLPQRSGLRESTHRFPHAGAEDKRADGVVTEHQKI